MPSSVRPSTLLRSLRTRLQFKNFDEMLEQLDVPVLVDFYGKNASHSLYISNATNVTTLQRPLENERVIERGRKRKRFARFRRQDSD